MTDKVTLEDFNVWDELFKNRYNLITVPLTIGTHPLFRVNQRPNYDYEITFKTNILPYYIGVTDTGYSRDLRIEKDDADRLIVSLQDNNINKIIFINSPKNEELPNQFSAFISFIPKYLNYYFFDFEYGISDDGDTGNRKCYITPFDATSINGQELTEDENGYSIPFGYCLNGLSDDASPLFKTFNLNFKSPYDTPFIDITQPLYVGHNNILTDKITVPVDYKLYRNNKELNAFYVPVGDYNNEYSFKFKGKSKSPYVPHETEIRIPVEYKGMTNIQQIDDFDYLTLKNNFTEYSQKTINSDCIIDGKSHNWTGAYYTVNSKLTFKNINFKKGQNYHIYFYNNGDITFENCTFELGVKINNKGRITFKNCRFRYCEGYILNDGLLDIINTEIIIPLNTDNNMPFIHNTGEYNLYGNNIYYAYQDTDICKGFGIAFIRTNDFNPAEFLSINTIEYDNCKLIINDANYLVNGNGVCYCNIKDDTLYFHDLEVVQDV